MANKDGNVIWDVSCDLISFEWLYKSIQDKSRSLLKSHDKYEQQSNISV